MATTLMIRTAATTVFVVVGSLSLSHAVANVAANRPQDQQPKSETKPKAEDKQESASLTGCVDEQDGKWVLVNYQTMAVIANLAADGFPTETFAKYLGHKVNVRGTANSGGSSSTFKVREIKTLSETCAAQ
jgi:hypothetical protein